MSLTTKFISAIRGVHELIVVYWPGPIGRRLRYNYYKRRLKFLGEGVVIDAGVHIPSPEWVSIHDNTWIDFYVIILAGPMTSEAGHRITHKTNAAFRDQSGEVHIGRNCHIAPHCLLQGHGGLRIGDNVGVASGAKIYSLSHHFRDLSSKSDNDATIYKFTPMAPPHEQALICSPVVLEDNTAVGLNSVILPGSLIGKDSWLGTCSLLSGSIGPGVIASGTPAVPVKDRFPLRLSDS